MKIELEPNELKMVKSAMDLLGEKVPVGGDEEITWLRVVGKIWDALEKWDEERGPHEDTFFVLPDEDTPHDPNQ
jgi:hypothetical protein